MSMSCLCLIGSNSQHLHVIVCVLLMLIYSDRMGMIEAGTRQSPTSAERMLGIANDRKMDRTDLAAPIDDWRSYGAGEEKFQVPGSDADAGPADTGPDADTDADAQR
jgi:hypothetical protein